MTIGQATTRQRILDAALELFARYGYAGTSVRALAAAVGVREGALYNHFRSKEDLYRSLLAQWGPAAFMERLRSEEYVQLRHDPRAFLETCVRDLSTRWRDRRDQLFAALSQSSREQLPAISDRYSAMLFGEELDELEAYFQGFVEIGAMRSADPRETARLFLAACVFIRREHVAAFERQSDEATLNAALQAMVENFLALTAPVDRDDAPR